LAAFARAKGPVPAPRLLAAQDYKQRKGMWRHRGFITFILMEKLPGRRLFDSEYWNMTMQQRDQIRTAFMTSLLYAHLPTVCPILLIQVIRSKIRNFALDPQDRGIRNLLWDEESETWLVSIYLG
jgi:hypothetical protein